MCSEIMNKVKASWILDESGQSVCLCGISTEKNQIPLLCALPWLGSALTDMWEQQVVEVRCHATKITAEAQPQEKPLHTTRNEQRAVSLSVQQPLRVDTGISSSASQLTPAGLPPTEATFQDRSVIPDLDIGQNTDFWAPFSSSTKPQFELPNKAPPTFLTKKPTPSGNAVIAHVHKISKTPLFLLWNGAWKIRLTLGPLKYEPTKVWPCLNPSDYARTKPLLNSRSVEVRSCLAGCNISSSFDF